MPDTPTTRATARLAWTRKALADAGTSLQPVAGDASARSYWRTQHDGHSVIVMDAPPPGEDIRGWLTIGSRLADAGIRVPRVYAHDDERGFALIEDLGDRLYLSELDATHADPLYADAMNVLLRLRTQVSTRQLPDYDTAFLRRELELFQPWFVQRHLGLAEADAAVPLLQPVFDMLVANALEQPQCFVHRDFHSRNLLVVADNNPAVIDFQGALCGPITYDLVSLLRDCYIRWDEHQVHAWVEGYRQQLVDRGGLDAGISPQQFRRWFDLAGMQRHLKVLGLFCRLAYRDHKPAYLADLPRVLDYVMTVANRYPEFSRFAEWLADITAGRDLLQTRPTGEAACAP